MSQDLQRGGFRYRTALVTVTYKPGVAWAADHISMLMEHYRKWCGRQGVRCRYVWVAEVQQRGAVHYHIVLWLPRGITPPKPDKQGWWKHGMSNCVWAHSPVGYIAKYASKAARDGGAHWMLDRFPKGLRLFGCGGLETAHRDELRWRLAPAWVRRFVPLENGVRRCRGGFWRDKRTGWVYGSPWEFVGMDECGAVHLRWRGFEADRNVFAEPTAGFVAWLAPGGAPATVRPPMGRPDAKGRS